MNRALSFATCLTVLLQPAALFAGSQTFTTADPAAAIPDNTGALGTCQTITVAGTGTIQDVTVQVSASHSWVGDLTYRLQSPAASQLTLINRPGRVGTGAGNDDNLVTTTPISYNDAAPSAVAAESMGAGCAGVIGVTAGCPDNYIPAPDAADTPVGGTGTNLAQYDGTAGDGLWTLCVADSAAGDTGTLASWSITVDFVPVGCTLNQPADVQVNNSPGQCGAVVNYPAPTTEGSCGTITCTPPSGSFFPVGTTLVTCTEDAPAPVNGLGGGGASTEFNVTVVDSEAPVITCPADIGVEITEGDPDPAVVFAPTAADNCPGATISCTPPSGSAFPVGTSGVNCSATDGGGLSGSCAFDVTVTAVPVGEEGSILEIPTLGATGLAAMGIALFALALFVLRRRGTQPN